MGYLQTRSGPLKRLTKPKKPGQRAPQEALITKVTRRDFGRLAGTVVLAGSGLGSAASAQEYSPRTNPAVTALMPQPRSITYGDDWLNVVGGFQVEWLGYRPSVLDRAMSRFQNDVARRTGLDVGRASVAPFRIDCRGEDKGYLTIDAREGYSLAVKDNAVVLTADGPVGVLRGLATLRQSITNVSGGFAIPAMAIDDATRFV